MKVNVNTNEKATDSGKNTLWTAESAGRPRTRRSPRSPSSTAAMTAPYTSPLTAMVTANGAASTRRPMPVRVAKTSSTPMQAAMVSPWMAPNRPPMTGAPQPAKPIRLP
jgi:hypothetical protein